MPRSHRLLGTLLVVLGLAPTQMALAQDPTPDPKKILSAARSTIQLARSFTYRARYEGTGLAQPSITSAAS